MVKFLLKNKGMTILGVKNILNQSINKLDDDNDHGLKTDYYKILLNLKPWGVFALK